MSDSLSIDFLRRIDARETIPEHSKVPKLTTSSLVSSRYTSKFVAQNGRSFGAGQVCSIRMNSSADYLVPSSGALFVQAKITAGDVVDKPVFDNVCSWLEKVRISVAGIQVEELNFASRAINAQALLSMSQPCVDTDGWNMYNTWKARGGGIASAGDLDADALNELRLTGPEGVVKRGASQFDNVGQNEQHFMIPLSFLGGLFKSHKLMNLRNLGNIQIDLFFAQNSDAIACANAVPFGIDAGTLKSPGSGLTPPVGLVSSAHTYEVTDAYILADLCCMNPDYVSVIDALVASPQGMVSPIETHTCLTSTSSLGAQSLKNFTYSFSTPCLKSITSWSQATSDLNNFAQYGASGFRYLSIQEQRLRIGRYYPMYDYMRHAQEHMYATAKAQGRWGNTVDAVGHVRRRNYEDKSTYAQCVDEQSFEKYTESGDVAIDGLDARLSGAVITLEQNSASTGAPIGTQNATGNAVVEPNPSQIAFALMSHLKILRQANSQLIVEDN